MQIRQVSLTVAAGLLAFGVSGAQAAPAARMQRDSERFDRTIPFQSGGRLNLNNFSGSVTITGTSGSDIVVHAVRHASREKLDRIHIGIDVNGSEVSIEANRRDRSWDDDHDNVVETEFQIEVPRQTELDIHVFSSNVHVSGVSGSQKLHAFSGRLEVVGLDGPVDASTFSGDIDVSLASSVDGHVDFETFSGQLDSKRPISVRTAGRHKGLRGDIGSGGNTELRFKTFSGDVTLR